MNSKINFAIRLVLAASLASIAGMKLFTDSGGGFFGQGIIAAAGIVELGISAMLLPRVTASWALWAVVGLVGIWLFLAWYIIPGGNSCGCFGIAGALERWKSVIAAALGLMAIGAWYSLVPSEAAVSEDCADLV